MGGKDVILLSDCVVGALNREQPDPETNDKAQRAKLVRNIVGNVVIGDAILALFDIRDSLHTIQQLIKGALTK